MTSHIDNQTLVVQYARVGIYILMLLVCVGSFLFQPGFINWGLLGPFYSLIGLGFFAHLLQLSYASQLKKIKALAFSGFVVDSLILSALVYYSGSYQSLFLFLHLLNILVAGIAFQSSGAFILALITSIGFSVASLFGPEIKAAVFLSSCVK